MQPSLHHNILADSALVDTTPAYTNLATTALRDTATTMVATVMIANSINSIVSVTIALAALQEEDHQEADPPAMVELHHQEEDHLPAMVVAELPHPAVTVAFRNPHPPAHGVPEEFHLIPVLTMMMDMVSNFKMVTERPTNLPSTKMSKRIMVAGKKSRILRKRNSTKASGVHTTPMEKQPRLTLTTPPTQRSSTKLLASLMELPATSTKKALTTRDTRTKLQLIFPRKISVALQAMASAVQLERA